MFGLKGIFDTDIDICKFQRFRRFRMNSLHTNISQLIGNNKICSSYRNHLIHTYYIRISARQVIFFMDNSLVGIYLYGNFAKSNLCITSIERTHNTLSTFCISGSNTNILTEINAFECSMNTLIYRKRQRVIKSAEIDKPSRDTIVIQNIYSIPR